MPMTPKSPRIGGGITGTAKASVNKVYQQMEQQKKKAAMPKAKPKMNPTTPGKVAPKKNRSPFEDNRMQ